MPGDQNSIDWVGSIEGPFVLRISKDSAQNRLDMLQCRFCEIVFLGDRAQHSTGIHGAKFSQVKLSDVIANMIDPDFMVALTGAGSTLSLVQGKYAPSTNAVSVILEFALNRSRLTVCMNDARRSSTSEISRKSLERPKCLERWLRLQEPSSFEIRWRYRTYHAPWCSYRKLA